MFDFYMPTRVQFGEGRLDALSSEVLRYGQRCFLVTTENVPPLDRLYTHIKMRLRDAGVVVTHFDSVVPNPPTKLVEEGVKALRHSNTNVILAVGGGSSIDVAKAIALFKDQSEWHWDMYFEQFSSPFDWYPDVTAQRIPIIAVPTTAGTGSEVTQASVLSHGRDKLTIFHPDNFPDVALLDPQLLLTLPPHITAVTGFDSFTHAFESYLSQRASPAIKALSLEAMRRIFAHLPAAVTAPQVLEHRSALMEASAFAGVSLANAGANAPHPISEVIGGMTHISHGEALALVFPEFIEVMSDRHHSLFSEIAQALDLEDLGRGICTLLKKIHLYRSWSDYGIAETLYQEIYHSPVFQHLPFGTQDEMHRILVASYAR